LQLIDHDEKSVASQKEEQPLVKPPPIPECPISFEPIRDPVILDCKCRPTVDRESFEVWLRHQTTSEAISSSGPPKCPCCSLTLLSMNVNPNVLLRDMIEATDRLEKEIAKKAIPENRSKHEEDPSKSKAIRVPTETKKGISKETLEKNPRKQEEDPSKNQSKRVAANVEQGTPTVLHSRDIEDARDGLVGLQQEIPKKTSQKDESKHGEDVWKNQAARVGWAQLQPPKKPFQDHLVKQDEEARNSRTTRVELVELRQQTHEEETCEETHSNRMGHPWKSQATKAPADVETGIPGKTLDENRSKHPANNQTTSLYVKREIPQTWKPEEEDSWNSQAITVPTQVKEGLLERHCVKSIQDGENKETEVISCSGRDATDDERSPGEAVKDVTQLCTEKRGLWLGPFVSHCGDSNGDHPQYSQEQK